MNGSNYEMRIIEREDMWDLERAVENEMEESWMPVGFTSYATREFSRSESGTVEKTYFACMMVREKQDTGK